MTIEYDLITVALVVVAVLIAIGWYLSYSAARLDRLHAKVEGAVSVLDAQLLRRAESSLELATSGDLDPASALYLADAATAAIRRRTEHPIGEDLLDGQHFAGREGIESDLTAALDRILTPEQVAALRAEGGDSLGADALDGIEAAALRVQLARQFHNDAVDQVLRVRAKPVVRTFRLAGHAGLPSYVEFDDHLPGAS